MKLSKEMKSLAAIILFLILAILMVAPSLTGKREMVPWDNLYGFAPWREADQSIEPHNMLISDMVLLSMPWQYFASAAWKQRTSLRWNPYILCGKPNYSGLLLGFRYPPNLVWRVIPPARATAWLFAFHLFVAALLTYLLARRLGVQSIAAMLAGITYSLSAPIYMNMTFPAMWGGLAWMPGCLLAIKGLADARHTRERAGWIAGGLIMHALVVLSGHPELIFYAFFFSGCFAAYLSFQAWIHGRKKISGLVAGFFVLFSIIGLAIIFPDLPSFRANFRADSVKCEDVRSYALPPYQPALLAAPNLYGSPVQHRYFDPQVMRVVKPERWRDVDKEAPPIDFGKKNYVEGSIYFGIIPLVMLLAAGFTKRDKLFFWFYLLLALLLSFGTPLYAVFYHTVPFARQLRTPFRWMIPAALCVSLLAGFGLDAWMRSASIRRRIRLLGSAFLVFAFFVILLVFTASHTETGLSRIATALYRQIPKCGDVLNGPSEFLRFELGQLFVSALWVALAGLGCLWAASFESVRRGALLLLGIAVLTLTTWAFPFYTHAPADLGGNIPASVKYLQADNTLFRIGVFGSDPRMLPPNSSMLYGLSDIRGYDSILPKSYVDFFNRIELQRAFLHYNIVGILMKPATLDSPWLDFLNLKYALTVDVVDRPGWSLCFSNRVNIYRNTEVYSRYYLAEELTNQFEEGPPRPISGALCEVTHYGLDRIVLSVDAPEQAWLVSSETDYGFWEARVDGVPVPAEPYLGIFRCVRVPSGPHRVEWALKK